MSCDGALIGRFTWNGRLRQTRRMWGFASFLFVRPLFWWFHYCGGATLAIDFRLSFIAKLFELFVFFFFLTGGTDHDS